VLAIKAGATSMAMGERGIDIAVASADRRGCRVAASRRLNAGEEQPPVAAR
jgi:hypothetical protein